MRTLLATLAIVLFSKGLLGALHKDPWTLSPPTDLPFKCIDGQPLQDCSKKQLCIRKSCSPGFRCVENYCGSCQAICVRSIGDSSCGKRIKLSPVCGRDGKTYASSCHARRAGVKLASRRACASMSGGCSCDMEYDPVCGDNKLFYLNRCVAVVCAKTGLAPWSNCVDQHPNPDCFCPYMYSPVCGVDGMTYSNACEAGCYNVTVAYEGECLNTCKALHSECDIQKQDCCKGLICGEFPVMHINMTTGRCWDERYPLPIGR